MILSPRSKKQKKFGKLPISILLFLYKKTLSPIFIALGFSCRFYPSCSDYAAESLHIHGVLRGLPKACWRVMRCHPWSAGGFDPVAAESLGYKKSHEIRGCSHG